MYTRKQVGILREAGLSTIRLENIEDLESREFIAAISSDEYDMRKETVVKIIKTYVGEFIENKNTDDEIDLKTRRELIISLKDLKKQHYTLEDYKRVEKAINESHQGLKDVKSELLKEIANAALKKTSPRPILLVGAPGCGKTSILTEVARNLNRGYEIISLSVLSGAFEIIGNTTAWKNAKCGKILQTCFRTSSLSPVIIFDELEKAGTDTTYANITSALLDLLEDDRKCEYTDNYLQVPVDLSSIWPLFTANSLKGIPEPILDRLKIIEMKPYSIKELENIASTMIKKNNGMIAPKSIKFTSDSIKSLAIRESFYSYSARAVRESVDAIFAENALSLLEGKETLMIRKTDLDRHYEHENIKIMNLNKLSRMTGVANAIAISQYVSFICPIEVNVYDEGDGIRILGMCGDEMQESAIIAYTVAEEHLRKSNMSLGLVNVNYITSIKKNGDSATLATALAIVSEKTKKILPHDTAITGALTMKGIVLPVGSLALKIQCAINEGMRKVIVPLENKKDIAEIEDELKKNIEICYVETFSEAIAASFGPQEKKFESAK